MFEPTFAGAFVRDNPLTLPAVRRLLAAGVDSLLLGALNGAGLIGMARVAVAADGSRFEPEGPDARLLLGVRDVAGVVVDVAAISTACEDEWALLTGEADLLGEDVLADAVAGERRLVRVFSTPMDWLRAGISPASGSAAIGQPKGVLVLRWGKVSLAALRGLPETCTLVVDPGAREKMRGMLAYGGLPQVAEDRPNWGRVA